MKPKRNGTKAVFWDFDGTLASGKAGWSLTVHKTLAGFGYDLSVDAVKAHMRTGFTWHRPEIEYTDRLGLWWEDLFSHLNKLFEAAGVDKAQFLAIDRRIQNEILSPERYQLYDDAVPALEASRNAGFSNYVLSNNFPELETVIEGLGLKPYIEKCIVSARVGFEKPHPGIFEIALREAGHPDPAYMVGDNPDADIRGGKAAGMITILVHNAAASQADHTLARLEDVRSVLG